MNIVPANAQHIGKRANQQDAFGFSDNFDTEFVSHSGFMAVLCDGMGGMALGEQASNRAVQAMLAAYMAKPGEQPISEALEEAFWSANRAVLNVAQEAGLDGDVGTTLAAAVIYKDQLYWISAGDSRIYLVREGNIIQLSEDHTYAMELEVMVQKGQLSREQADSDPERAALVSYLGMQEPAYICASVRPMALKPEDTVILCSDGLYGSLTPEELKCALASSPNDPYGIVQVVLDKQLPHQDNITIATLACKQQVSDTQRTTAISDDKPKSKRKRFCLYAAMALIFLAIVSGLGIYYKFYTNVPSTSTTVEGAEIEEKPR